MEPVFLDTAALLALINRDDQWHAKAKEIEALLTTERAPLVTSDWVLLEFLNAASRPRWRDAACRVVDRLRKSSRTTIAEASRASWSRAFELFESRTDKEWSFVDCSTIDLCRQRGIPRVFSSDHHFIQAGLEILMR